MSMTKSIRGGLCAAALLALASAWPASAQEKTIYVIAPSLSG